MLVFVLLIVAMVFGLKIGFVDAMKIGIATIGR
jgi:hypothetical protein